jgi:hypothetical protein
MAMSLRFTGRRMERAHSMNNSCLRLQRIRIRIGHVTDLTTRRLLGARALAPANGAWRRTRPFTISVLNLDRTSLPPRRTSRC